MCLAAQKPLIDAGTAGFLGQSTVHVPVRIALVISASFIQKIGGLGSYGML